MAEQISQKDARQTEATLDRVVDKAKQTKFLLSEVTGAGVAGFAVGYMCAANPSLDKGWLDGRVKLDHVVAVGGLVLGRKRTRTGALARGAGLGATYKLAEEQGRKAGTKPVTPPKP